MTRTVTLASPAVVASASRVNVADPPAGSDSMAEKLAWFVAIVAVVRLGPVPRVGVSPPFTSTTTARL